MGAENTTPDAGPASLGKFRDTPRGSEQVSRVWPRDLQRCCQP